MSESGGVDEVPERGPEWQGDQRGDDEGQDFAEGHGSVLG